MLNSSVDSHFDLRHIWTEDLWADIYLELGFRRPIKFRKKSALVIGSNQIDCMYAYTYMSYMTSVLGCAKELGFKLDVLLSSLTVVMS